MESGEDVCSTREAADRLGVSLRTVQLWSEAGLLRAWKTPGGHRRILADSIDELLERRSGAAARRATGGQFRILIVEDEADFRQLFELHLRSWDLPIDLTSVPSGFEALLQIGASRPDLLITDLRMPGIDGFVMLRALKASGAISELELKSNVALRVIETPAPDVFEVLGRGEVVIEADGVGQIADPVADFARRRMAEKRPLTCVRIDNAENHAQRRRLARTIGAQYAVDHAARDGEADAPDRRGAAECLDQSLGPNGRVVVQRRFPSSIHAW